MAWGRRGSLAHAARACREMRDKLTKATSEADYRVYEKEQEVSDGVSEAVVPGIRKAAVLFQQFE